MTDNIRNIAIIAHVDHGKTTLVDKLLQQSGTLKKQEHDRIMDSNELEKERGITILSKTTAINWQNHHINIVDTPGHADFGGEVERILSMVDSVLLLVDAVDGPMPQTRFVTEKAFSHGLHPLVVVNKIDRTGARPDWVIDQIFELFDELGATDEQLDFTVIYTSAINGISGLDPESMAEDMTPLFQTLVDKVPPPSVDTEGPLQLQICALDYSSYVGVIGIGRIKQGKISANSPVTIVNGQGKQRPGRVNQVMTHLGLDRVQTQLANAGDIVCITGIDNLKISDTLCNSDSPMGLPPLTVEEPTVSMTFQVNDSPFSGKEGKFLTSRHIKARLEQEASHNVALLIEETDHPDKFKVSGRGELQLSVLIETMRREGYELGVSRPEVIIKEIDGKPQEPYETLILDVETQHQGAVMEYFAERKGELQNLAQCGKDRVRIDYIIPAKSLIGTRTHFLTMTSGSGIMNNAFSHYGDIVTTVTNQRAQGALISNGQGKTLAYALFNLQQRGRLLVGPGVETYTGMIIGLHSRDNDLVVNPLKAKQLTNVRASGTDESLILTPHLKLTLEQALEFIDDDELVEVTPAHIRIRKKMLSENERKRAGRNLA